MSTQVQKVVDIYKQAYVIPRQFHLPKEVVNKEPFVPEGTDLAIWTWEANNRLYGIAFQGKSNKPLWHWAFSNEARRQKLIDETTESRRQRLKNKEDEQKKRREYQHDYKVGDIFSTSWGYDQTNVDFYQVTELVGDKMLELRKIGKEVVEEKLGSESVVAVPDDFIGSETYRVRPTSSGGVRIKGHYGSKWNGKPSYQTPFGMGH